MKIATLLGIITLTTSSLSAYAEMYRWVDDDGSVHYTAMQPEDGRTVNKISAPPPAASKSDQELASEKAQREAEAAAQNPILDPKYRQENCDRALENLAALLNSKAGDHFKTAEGENITFTESQLATKISENRLSEKAFCD